MTNGANEYGVTAPMHLHRVSQSHFPNEMANTHVLYTELTTDGGTPIAVYIAPNL